MLHARGIDQCNSSKLDFLWLELTNACNLTCKHCYADSSPLSGVKDRLSRAEYEKIIADARAIGCESVQFIGGEPTLNKDISHFIQVAVDLGYSFIEIFTNLIRLPDHLMRLIVRHKVHVATSIYGHAAHIHDSVTGKAGSFNKTIANLDRLIALGVPIRAGFIEMEGNSGLYSATENFLTARGVSRVGHDRIRRFGRGNEANENVELEELCGACAKNVLSVNADGTVSPCIMSKKWAFGDIKKTTLRELAEGDEIHTLRGRINEVAIQKEQQSANGAATMSHACVPEGCHPCAPDAICGPCAPNTSCDPTRCKPYCTPN
jgi:MoaA/NifB/PqqE/SkfB family radical SAM enzyme